MTSLMQIARQPIFDKDNNIYAYELLSRPCLKKDTNEEYHRFDGDEATNKLIKRTFESLGLEQVSGGHDVFINFTRNLLLDPIHSVLPHAIAVIEVLEDVVIDQLLIDKVKNIIDEGYRVALDDFVYCNEVYDLVVLADYIKVDVLAHTRDELIEQAEILQPFKAKLLAEKVEDKEIYDLCIDLGFELFQGYYLAKPELVEEECQ